MTSNLTTLVLMSIMTSNVTSSTVDPTRLEFDSS